ncbi:hypothetical protein HMPREF2528_07980 [Rothia sp. HMSC078H08]|nr:hypothetical protein HMPREF2528_07980 [Rothia sp. HMSC078H08]
MLLRPLMRGFVFASPAFLILGMRARLFVCTRGGLWLVWSFDPGAKRGGNRWGRGIKEYLMEL